MFFWGKKAALNKSDNKHEFEIGCRHSRALPDTVSGPEVRQIFKIQTVRKPDVFLPGGRTLRVGKEFKKKKNSKFFFHNFLVKCLKI